MTIKSEILSAILTATQVFSIFFIIILVYKFKLANAEKERYRESYYNYDEKCDSLESEKRDLRHQIFVSKENDEKIKRNMEKLLSLHTRFRLKYDSAEALYCIDKYVDALGESFDVEDREEEEEDDE